MYPVCCCCCCCCFIIILIIQFLSCKIIRTWFWITLIYVWFIHYREWITNYKCNWNLKPWNDLALHVLYLIHWNSDYCLCTTRNDPFARTYFTHMSWICFFFLVLFFPDASFLTLKLLLKQWEYHIFKYPSFCWEVKTTRLHITCICT